MYLEPKSKAGQRDRAAHNYVWAAAIVDSLVAAGVRHAVLSPGAQMAPLDLACRQNEMLECSVVVDERSAAFHALGLARGSATPVVLVGTSGSAVGQYYPAIMEANLGMVPLIVLTTDKSPEDHGRGVAQTMDQDRVYSTHVRAAHNLRLPDETIDLIPSLMGRMVETALWPTPGPVHMNIAFRPPLVPEGRERLPGLPLPPKVSVPRIAAREQEIVQMAAIMSGRPGVIVCGARELGHGFADAVGALASAVDCPLFADACSGVRFGPHDRSSLVTYGDAFLRREIFREDCRPEWVLRFGGTPTSDPLLAWLNACGASEHIVVDDMEFWPDPLRRARTTRVVRAHAETVCRQLMGVAPAPRGWLDSFRNECRRADRLMARLNEDTPGFWEAQIIHRLIGALADGDTLLIGNSTPIRDFDSFSGQGPKSIRMLANRGTNGIDGGVAFLLGLARCAPGRTVGMIGDLAFSHDIGSLQLGRGQDVTLIVVNNGGGTIFEYQAVAGIDEFDDFLAPPGIEIGDVARAFGWSHARVGCDASFTAALDTALLTPGPNLIEIMVDRRKSVARHHQFTALVGE
jgi:2-succinyl-5-enolpyruvyl-6-hydroxy-3-cyclohexene-1-carboxylate synthase